MPDSSFHSDEIGRILYEGIGVLHGALNRSDYLKLFTRKVSPGEERRSSADQSEQCRGPFTLGRVDLYPAGVVLRGRSCRFVEEPTPDREQSTFSIVYWRLIFSLELATAVT